MHVTLALASLFFIYVAMEKRHWNLGGLNFQTSREWHHGLNHSRSDVFLRRANPRARRCAPGIAPPEGKNSRTWRIGLGGRRRCSPHRVSGRICGHRCGSFLQDLVVPASTPFTSPGSRDGTARRAKKIGGVLFALASLGGSVGPWLVGSVSQLTGRLANWTVGSVALCADHDWPGADVAAADHRLRYSLARAEWRILATLTHERTAARTCDHAGGPYWAYAFYITRSACRPAKTAERMVM